MRKLCRHIFLTILLLSIIINLLGEVTVPKSPKDKFIFPKLNSIKLPEVNKLILNNGIKLFLVEDHSYPTIGMRAIVNAGSGFEPKEKIGLAEITGKLLRKGGTKRLTGDEIDRRLEEIAASIDIKFSQDYGIIDLSMLKENVDELTALLADMVRQPAFSKEKMELAKIKKQASIARRNDNTMQLALREFKKLIYGANNPYARHTEYNTLDSITRKDIVAYHLKYVHPNNMIIAVWGDFDTKVMAKKFDKELGDWQPDTFTLPTISETKYDFKHTINYIFKPDTKQSSILIGHIGGILINKDTPALIVMNNILSNERMFKKIRTKEKLAYRVWTDYGTRYRTPGIFNMGAQVKSEATVFAIKLMLRELKNLQMEEVSQLELNRAKEQYLNTYVFTFDSREKIVKRMLTYAFFKYPQNFSDQFIKDIGKVTKADILRVAQKYLKPEQVHVLVVGNKDFFSDPLSTLGPINTIDVTIPLQHKKKPSQDPKEDRNRGRKFFKKAIEALGDPQKIKNIKNYSMSCEITRVIPMGEMKMESKSTFEYPDKINLLIKSFQGDIEIILNGEKSVTKIGGQKIPMAEPQRKETLANYFLREPLYIYKNINNYTITFLGKKQFNGKDIIELMFTGSIEPFYIYFDAKSYLPVGSSYQITIHTGPATIVKEFSEYTDIDGIKVAFKSITKSNGKKSGADIIKEMKFNKIINKNLFDIQ